jgi:predicted RND superfamily exporter protein
VLSLLRVTSITIDTDPENMLSESEWVRVFHSEVKRDFALSDMIVLGVVNEQDPEGVFNPATLAKIYRITEGIRGIDGVVVQDVLAFSTVDDVLQAGPGTVRFQYLMERPPASREEALHIRDRVLANPFLFGTLVSEDGKALAVYIPILEKKIAHRVSGKVRTLIGAEPPGPEDYHITGLPVAEDTFGVEMFQQMAISAPLAGLLIFLLMLFFFRKPVLVVSPMIVAMLTVMTTMGLLIATGNTVHIMSSMIPIFLMPIAVVDSVHILSVFFDRYRQYRDREKTITVVMEELFTPMFYTSLTTMVGFGSLVLAPIPPVRVFGLFVALGVFLAWALTVTLVPAYIMVLIPERRLAGFGAVHHEEEEGHSPLARLLAWCGRWTLSGSRPILVVLAAVLVLSAYGISRIHINDNPVKWFVKDHPVRIADEVLNRHFSGTYEAYLVFQPPSGPESLHQELEAVAGFLDREARTAESPTVPGIVASLKRRLPALEAAEATSERPNPVLVVEALAGELDDIMDAVPDEDLALLEDLDLLAEGLEDLRTSLHTFKDPAVLRYIEGLQEHLAFQGSHDPEEVWHLVTPDYRRLNLWAQLKSGDNRDMEEAVGTVDAYLSDHPPPVPLEHAWAGLTYLNVVWQDRMVKGMLRSLLSSFAIVLVIMSLLYRSVRWGILSMIPLTMTIALLYGLIGLIGKDYDMVMAILSSLTLGLSIDFAIHYIQRTRRLQAETGAWTRTAALMSAAPARAIARNAIIIAVGFLPLLLSSLRPYRTVGVFLATIMMISGMGTLVILPALIQNLSGRLFGRAEEAPAEPEKGTER